MTLSQIIRNCRWEDVLHYIRQINYACGQIMGLIPELCESTFYELQSIEPDDEALNIKLIRKKGMIISNYNMDKYHRFDASIFVSSSQRVYRYMWSRYLGATVTDLGDNYNSFRGIDYDPDEDDQTRAERYRMPDAAIAANIIIHLTGNGYSQVEAENNIKRAFEENLMGYSVYYIHQLLTDAGLMKSRQILEDKILDKEVVCRFLENTENDKMLCFSTYFSTQFKWCKWYYSSATSVFEDMIITFGHDKALMIITYPASFDLNGKIIAMIKHLLYVPKLGEVVFVEDKNIDNRIKVEVFAC